MVMRHRIFAWGLLAMVAAAGLLAGCLQPAPNPVPSLAYGPGFHPQPYRNLTLEAEAVPETVRPGEAQEWRIRVVHDADSEDDFVYSAICESPWKISLADAYGRDLHTDPHQMVCLAYGEAHLGPGEAQRVVWTWDGRHHPDGGPDARDLAPGAYVLTFQFESLEQRGEGPRAFYVFQTD